MIWFVLLEEGAYSDYFARIGSVWATQKEAETAKKAVEEEIKYWREKRAKWEKERDELWDTLKPGHRKYWDFSSELKKREWHTQVPEFPFNRCHWDRVSVIAVPLATPGEYWLDDDKY